MPISLSHKPVYSTPLGEAYCGDSRILLKELKDESINLVLTSPPFALQRKKEYGNKNQEEYIDWLAEFASIVYKKLKNNGSFVMDLGGAYQKNSPTRSLYNFRILLKFCDDLGFHLAEDFYWFNPSKLPSPIEWVNKRKIRVKDSINTIWWFSKTEWPKSDIRNVLTEYSPRMKKLLENPTQFYLPAKRPSGHEISKSFCVDNGGALPSNLLQIPNSESNSTYLSGCKLLNIKGHPARFPSKLPEFFIKMLTDPGDLIVDIFAGSNTTGACAEINGRKWVSFEERLDYLASSVFRFLDISNKKEVLTFYNKILNGEEVNITKHQRLLEIMSDIIKQRPLSKIPIQEGLFV